MRAIVHHNKNVEQAWDVGVNNSPSSCGDNPNYFHIRKLTESWCDRDIMQWITPSLFLTWVTVSPLTIDRTILGTTFKIENNNYSKTPPEVAVSKDFLI